MLTLLPFCPVEIQFVLSQEEGGRLQDVVENEVLNQDTVLVVDKGVETVDVEHLIHGGVGHGQRVVGVGIFEIGFKFAGDAVGVGDAQDGSWNGVEGRIHFAVGDAAGEFVKIQVGKRRKHLSHAGSVEVVDGCVALSQFKNEPVTLTAHGERFLRLGGDVQFDALQLTDVPMDDVVAAPCEGVGHEAWSKVSTETLSPFRNMWQAIMS